MVCILPFDVLILNEYNLVKDQTSELITQPEYPAQNSNVTPSEPVVSAILRSLKQTIAQAVHPAVQSIFMRFILSSAPAYHFSGCQAEHFYQLNFHFAKGADFHPNPEDLLLFDELRLQFDKTLTYKDLKNYEKFLDKLCECVKPNIEIVVIHNIDFSGAEKELKQLILAVVHTRALKLNFVECVIPEITLGGKEEKKEVTLECGKLRPLYSLGVIK